uniref:Uncharacterized protein n=1 Tax=Timema douglasi TaxID=61478 RepID=A0A7R8VLG7_TIMDO|nr:unnamed protein product [Timema douglasi]
MMVDILYYYNSVDTLYYYNSVDSLYYYNSVDSLYYYNSVDSLYYYNSVDILYYYNSDEAALASKESELRKVQGLFDKLKSAQEEDKVALEAAQRKFQAVSSGLLSADDGTNATLEDQLMNAKQAVAQAQTEKKQAEMQLAPCQKELREKEQEMKKTSSNYEGDRQKLENMERELKTLEDSRVPSLRIWTCCDNIVTRLESNSVFSLLALVAALLVLSVSLLV